MIPVDPSNDIPDGTPDAPVDSRAIHRLLNSWTEAARHSTSEGEPEFLASMLRPYWLVQFLTKQPESLASAVKTHKKVHSAELKRIELPAMAAIVSHLQNGFLPTPNSAEVKKPGSGQAPGKSPQMGRPVSPAVAELLAEVLVCQYLKQLSEGLLAPRPSALKAELEAVRRSARNFQGVLKSSSKETKRLICNAILRPYDITLGEEELRTLLINRRNSGAVVKDEQFAQFFFTPESQYRLDDAVLNSEFLDAMSAFDVAITFALTNGRFHDVGGRVVGDHDGVGERAKEFLVLEGRLLLGYLGLKNGSQRGGPLVKFLEIVQHCADPNASAAWVDKYAGRAACLERADPWSNLGPY